MLLVSLWNIIVLGDLAFHEVKKGSHAGSDQWVVILSSTTSINKAI